MRLNSRVEVVSFQPWPDRTGYFKVEVAVNGKVAWPFDVYEGDWKQMTDEQRAMYLERTASTLLHRYGDRREIRIREDGAIVALNGEVETEV